MAHTKTAKSKPASKSRRHARNAQTAAETNATTLEKIFDELKLEVVNSAKLGGVELFIALTQAGNRINQLLEELHETAPPNIKEFLSFIAEAPLELHELINDTAASGCGNPACPTHGIIAKLTVLSGDAQDSLLKPRVARKS
jgi:hypothetical protein